jgi:hypothetical protein
MKYRNDVFYSTPHPLTFFTFFRFEINFTAIAEIYFEMFAKTFISCLTCEPRYLRVLVALSTDEQFGANVFGTETEINCFS